MSSTCPTLNPMVRICVRGSACWLRRRCANACSATSPCPTPLLGKRARREAGPAGPPAATPDAVVQTLATSVNAALKRPELQARMNSLDLFYEGATGLAAAQRLASLSARYGQIVRNTGMQAN